MSLPAADFGGAPSIDDVPPLTVLIESAVAHSLDAEKAPLVIGRPAAAGEDLRADICIADHRISRQHLKLSVSGGQWIATDLGSTNGTFINGQKVDEFVIPQDEQQELTVHLGHPVEGIVLTFSTQDAGVVFAGAAFAKARKEKRISQRQLAEMKIMNAGALINFEKGRSWPRASTRERLENALGWPKGRIAQLRRDYASGGMTTTVTQQPIVDPDTTAVLPPSPESTSQHPIDPSFLAQWANRSLVKAREHRAGLPASNSRNYPAEVERLISELSSLEALVVHSASSAPQLREVFLQVRAELREVMLQAAQSPLATAGQLLFAARDRARLSAEEAAVLAGVPQSSVKAFEAGNTVNADEAALLHGFLASLQ